MSFIKKKSNTHAKILKGISFLIVACLTGRAETRAVAHQINSKFEIFDQITLEMSNSASPLAEAIRFTKSSGADVPNANIVRPTTIGGIHILCATLELHPTSISHHQTSDTSHSTMKNDEIITPSQPAKMGSI